MYLQKISTGTAWPKYSVFVGVSLREDYDTYKNFRKFWTCMSCTAYGFKNIFLEEVVFGDTRIRCFDIRPYELHESFEGVDSTAYPGHLQKFPFLKSR